MAILQHLSSLALGPTIRGVCEAAGISLGISPADNVAVALVNHFRDQSQRVADALHRCNDRAWHTLEVALAGESWWGRVKGVLTGRDHQALAAQVRAFLDAVPMSDLANKTHYREACVKELREARKKGVLLGAPAGVDPANPFVRFVDPLSLVAAEAMVVSSIAQELQREQFGNLAHLLTLQAAQGQSLLAVAVRYYFRRAIEDDPRLFQGLTHAQLGQMQEQQEQGFAALHQALSEQSGQLVALLGDVQTIVTQTQEAVLDIQAEQQRQGAQARELYTAVIEVQRRLDLMQREVRPRDSLSIRSDAERNLVRQIIARYRSLPEAQRNHLPALLNAIGKLEVAAGDFDAAERDFVAVANLVSDSPAKAEAHANAYRAALEKRDWDRALRELIEAIKLDGRRFAPFPVGKYHPLRILGAGGFGVAFLCRHRQLDADVVVKTLSSGGDLEHNLDQVFTEARVLWQLDHPAIIRLLDCGYTFPQNKSRPYFVMHYFDGLTLEDHVKKHGPLPPPEMGEVALLMAQGLHAAHQKGILHRDVKPANVLVRKDGTGWQVKLIDFGLAMKSRLLQNAATATAEQTILGASIAGTLEYAAPEQMGKLPGVRVGPPADIYGLAKTCCYALYESPEPTFQDWQRTPTAWSELMGRCLNKNPQKRPAGLAEVIDALLTLRGRAVPVATAVPVAVAAPASGSFPNLDLGPAAAETDGRRFDELKTMLQKQVRESDWEAAWITVDAMLEIKPLDREVLEARDYIDQRRRAAKQAPKKKAPDTQSDIAVEPPRAKKQRKYPNFSTLEDDVMKILRTYVSDAALLLAPSIPEAKLANASTSCLLPKGEKVLALIDCTVFGSASDCVLFGTRGLYYHNSAGANPNPAFIPYDDFPRCSFVKYWVWCVTVEGEKYFNISGSNANRGKLIEMLHEMKRMIADRPVPEVEPVPLDEDEEPDGFVGALSEVVKQEAWSRKGSGLGGWEAKLPERVLAILRNYQGQADFHVYPNIPEKKLVNALGGCSVPAQEKLLGLIDCTVFGSASDAVVFGQKGIYYHNMGGNVPDPGVLLYRDFPDCTFENYWLNCVSFGRGLYLNKAGSNFSRDNIVAILSAIRDVVIDLRD